MFASVKWQGLVRRLALLAVALFVVGSIAYPLAVLVPLLDTSTQQGMLELTRDVCQALGPDAAVVMLQDEIAFPEATFSQTVRGACDVPVALAPGDIGFADLQRLAGIWAAEGRRLYVVSSRTHPLPLSWEVLAQAEFQLLERTIERRPAQPQTGEVRLVGAVVPPEG
ncbi:MAG: hypothetical protein M3N51_04735 [Actinomycetota bacterium]|nr:hypothetical protein [Actinomycetota bacterium]